jgi:hypothetical protein
MGRYGLTNSQSEPIRRDSLAITRRMSEPASTRGRPQRPQGAVPAGALCDLLAPGTGGGRVVDAVPALRVDCGAE